MNTNKIALVLASVALLFAIGAYLKAPQDGFGGSTRSNWSVGGNLTVTGNDTVTGDLTVNGGNVNVTTGASATSTLVVGAIEAYATSSLTKLCIGYNTQATTSIQGTAAGVVTWRYGDCNSL